MLVVVIYLVVVTLLDVENLVDAGALVVDFALVVFPWVTDNGSVLVVIAWLTEEMVIELVPKKYFSLCLWFYLLWQYMIECNVVHIFVFNGAIPL